MGLDQASAQVSGATSKLVPVFPAEFAEIERGGLRRAITTYGGCFNFRAKRSSSKLSTHSWGIAIDLNPETNAMGRPGDMPRAVVDVFESFGFTWGGRWIGQRPERVPNRHRGVSNYEQRKSIPPSPASSSRCPASPPSQVTRR